MEGDIFEGVVFDLAPVKKLFLRKIYKGVLKLSFNISDILDNVVSKVASTVTLVEKMGIHVEWIDRLIDAKRDHFELLHEARLLRIQFEELQE